MHDTEEDNHTLDDLAKPHSRLPDNRRVTPSAERKSIKDLNKCYTPLNIRRYTSSASSNIKQ